VVATGDGVVLIARINIRRARGGRQIVIDHLSTGFQTRYSQIDTVLVKKGQDVKFGDVIAGLKHQTSDPAKFSL